jgi:hypothetical protein
VLYFASGMDEHRTEKRPGRRKCDAHRREIERQVRQFLAGWKGKNLNFAAGPTRRFIEEITPIVEQLDKLQECAPVQ